MRNERTLTALQGRNALSSGRWAPSVMSMIAACAVAIFAAAFVGGCSRDTPRRHHVLVITFDTTRTDRLEPYGGPSGLTPTVQGLAARGVVFERAQSQAAVTPVAHASLFTGLNPYKHGLRTLHGNRHYRLPDNVPTLALRLRELGYTTAAFVSAFPCGSRFGLEQGFDHFDESFDQQAATIGASGNVTTGRAQRDAGATTNAVLEWLASRKKSEPFFIWVHYFDPHDPLLRPPPEYTEQFVAGVAEHREMDALLDADARRFAEVYATRPEVMRPWLKGLYDAEVHHADGQLDRILNELAAQGLLSETLVVMTADHGEGLGDHGWWGHGILYQEQIRVPLILAGPAVPWGVRVPDRVRHIDVAPTVLELAASATFGREIQGISLVPLIEARSASREPMAGTIPGPAYADSVALMRYGAVFSRDVVEEKDDQLYVWIEGDLKWIRHRYRQVESELYDLASDPGERVNLLLDRPRDAGRLDALLEREQPVIDTVTLTLPEDDDARHKLRSLGYVE